MKAGDGAPSKPSRDKGSATWSTAHNHEAADEAKAPERFFTSFRMTAYGYDFYGLLRFITCSCYRRLPLLRSAQAKNERERSKTAKPCAR
jgi:hypothetical protein